MSEIGAYSCCTEGEELDTAKICIEHNATDADTGLHGLFGGTAWREPCLWDPSGRLILVVDPEGSLGTPPPSRPAVRPTTSGVSP